MDCTRVFLGYIKCPLCSNGSYCIIWSMCPGGGGGSVILIIYMYMYLLIVILGGCVVLRSVSNELRV